MPDRPWLAANRSTNPIVLTIMRDLFPTLFGMMESVTHTRAKAKRRKLIFTPTAANLHRFRDGRQALHQAAAVAAGVKIGATYRVIPSSAGASRGNAVRLFETDEASGLPRARSDLIRFNPI